MVIRLVETGQKVGPFVERAALDPSGQEIVLSEPSKAGPLLAF